MKERLRLRARELVTVAVVGIAAGGVWLFAEIADQVAEGESRAFDTAVLLAMRNPDDLADPIGPRWLEEVGRDLTALGGIAVLVLVTLGAAGFLWLTGDRRSVVLLVAAVTTGVLLSLLLKGGFDRPRPDLVPHGSIVYTRSFPSGHSMLSAITYLTIGALVARVRPERRVQAFVLTMAVALTLLTGLSRVYLGVHWPTDVLAGWAAGAAWAAICWSVAEFLARRGRIEAAPPRVEA